MKLADRKAFLRKKGFCYGCMDGRHLSRTCSKRKECQTCGGLHPTVLHYDAREEGNETTEADTNVTAHCTKASAASVISHQTDIFDVAGHYNSLIVPVMLYRKDAPDECIMVYALLDDQSNSTFIAQQTMDKLKATGQPVKIKMATMLADKQSKVK